MIDNFISIEGKSHFAVGLKDSLTRHKIWYVFAYPAPALERGETPKAYEKRMAAYKKLAFKSYKTFDGFVPYEETSEDLVPIKGGENIGC